MFVVERTPSLLHPMNDSAKTRIPRRKPLAHVDCLYLSDRFTFGDVPYPEMVRAARDIAGEMYRPMPKPHVHFPPEPARVR